MKIAIPMSTSKTQHYINFAYVEYVHAAGFEPITITPVNNIDDVSSWCDGLLLPGGIDIDPIFYGEDNVAAMSSDPDKDAFERELLYSFFYKNKPVFGICRGMQLIVKQFLLQNQTFRNKLVYYQHISGHSLANERNVSRTQPTHHVIANNALYGDTDTTASKKIFVNSMHHQCLCVTQDKDRQFTTKFNNMTILAHTKVGLDKKDKEVIVEAIGIGNKIKAVQWHPEELMDTTLIKIFFDNANQGDADVKHE